MVLPANRVGFTGLSHKTHTGHGKTILTLMA
nr:MAG TPA: Elongation factor Tu-B state, conserved switch I.6A [Caudoviricetes sp.]